jgi:hypothetical protein
MLRRILGFSGALLVLFHAWLFAGQAWQGRLADPSLLLEWTIAAGLLAGLHRLRRRGHSLFRSRQGVAIWLLAALLHGPAVADAGFTAWDAPALPEIVAVLAPVALAGAAAVGLGVVLGLLASARRRAPVTFRALADAGVLSPAPSLRTYVVLAPRPPPVR